MRQVILLLAVLAASASLPAVTSEATAAARTVHASKTRPACRSGAGSRHSASCRSARHARTRSEVHRPKVHAVHGVRSLKKASGEGHRGPHGTAPAANPTSAAAPAAEAGASAAGRAASIAAALATPCQNTNLIPTAADLDLVRAAVLCLINQKRAQSGEAPLALNQQLVDAAEGHSQELVADDYFAHVSPSGLTPVDRIRETGYIPGPEVGYVIGENLAWGTYELATPQAIVSAWIASPGHLANILESQYVETGIGVTPEVPPSLADGAPGATYAQEFGVIIR